MSWIRPDGGIGPKEWWRLDKVLHYGGENGIAIAEGQWDGKPCLGIRRNGTDKHPAGTPVSGLGAKPIWLIFLEKDEADGAIAAALRVAAAILERARRG